MIVVCDEKKIEENLDLSISQNQKILNRNEKEWEEFCDEFTITELLQMKDYVCAHPVNIEYDMNDYDDVSILIHDYIIWLVFDLTYWEFYSDAKAVLNNGYIG